MVTTTGADGAPTTSAGALNLLTPDVVLAATEVCRTGKMYSLALPIQRKGVAALRVDTAGRRSGSPSPIQATRGSSRTTATPPVSAPTRTC